MKKIFVLDTNVILSDPRAIFSFQDNQIIIPMVVVEEIDNFKKTMDNVGFAAREFSREMDSLRKNGNLFDGVKTEDGGNIKIVQFDKTELKQFDLDLNINDNIILATTLLLKDRNKKSSVILVSRDINVRIKADYYQIESENYSSDYVNFQSLYKGYEVIFTGGENIDAIFSKKKMSKEEFEETFVPKTLYPNTFYLLKDESKEQHQAVVRYDPATQNIKPIINGKTVVGIKARNLEQKMALELLLDDNVKMVSLIGSAGTGKTLLALAAGLQKVVEDGAYSRLLIARPIVPMGNDLGYLPGTMEEKLRPWIQPVFDNLDFILYENKNIFVNDKIGSINSVDDFIKKDLIEIEALTYVRGRSIPNQFIIIDEAQNLTAHEIKTIITRIGEGSKIVFTGDPFQIDSKYLDENTNGLSYAVDRMKELTITGSVILEKGERSELATQGAKYL